jgi:pyruvate carboxylase
LQFPGPSADYAAAFDRFWDVSLLPTEVFLHGLTPGREVAVDLRRGTRVYLGLQAVTDADERGFRTVLLEVNGQARPIEIQDHSIQAEVPLIEAADPSDRSHVAAPLTGVITWTVETDAEVAAGAPVATIEAMKMESTISAPHAGRVQRVAASAGTAVEPGDLVAVVVPASR